MSRDLFIDTGAETAYTDLPRIPKRLAREFVFSTFADGENTGEVRSASAQDEGPAPDLGYDLVSDTIATYGIWEPDVTLIMSAAFAGHPEATFLDFGCQAGYYGAIADAFGLDVVGFDGNPDAVMLATFDNGYDLVISEMIEEGFTLPKAPIFDDARELVVKADVEGAEIFVVQALHDELVSHRIKHMVLEVSPSFADYYPKLIRDVSKLGYECWTMPWKRRPPSDGNLPISEILADSATKLSDLKTLKAIGEAIGEHQINVVFSAPDAVWG